MKSLYNIVNNVQVKPRSFKTFTYQKIIMIKRYLKNFWGVYSLNEPLDLDKKFKGPPPFYERYHYIRITYYFFFFPSLSSLLFSPFLSTPPLPFLPFSPSPLSILPFTYPFPLESESESITSGDHVTFLNSLNCI